jgi:peptide/nickel transport system ATP-binding protein
MTQVAMRGVRKVFGATVALESLDLEVADGELVCLLGPSGCGKTTALRILAGFERPDAGEVHVAGEDITKVPTEKRGFGMVFQEYSLFPNMTARQNIEFGLKVRKMATGERTSRVDGLLEVTGLTDHAAKFPHQLSGGQKQRVVIARALTLRPKLIVCDEVVAALDMSIRGDVLNLFADLQRELGLTYVFITHDLAVVSHISERVAVMYLGRFVELGPTESVSERPLHPYTQALLSAEPRPLPSSMRDGERIVLEGEIPSPIDPPSGCRFRTRCRYAQDICADKAPDWRELAAGHWVACHFADRPNFSPN